MSSAPPGEEPGAGEEGTGSQHKETATQTRSGLHPPTPTSPPAPPLTGKGRRGGQPGRRGSGEGGLGAPRASGRRGRAGGNTRSGPLNVAPAPANSFRLDGLFRTGDTGLPHS